MDMVITIIVAGTETLQYLPQLIGWPSFWAIDVPTTFAEAPIGVALPPMSVPMARVHARTEGAAPVAADIDLMTGIIVAANGIKF